MTLDDTSRELVLPTFSVLARFLEPAATADDALARVAERLRAADEPVHEVRVERQESEGQWMVVARFVLVSVDAATAVGGLQETLTGAGIATDEVWADAQLS